MTVVSDFELRDELGMSFVILLPVPRKMRTVFFVLEDF